MIINKEEHEKGMIMNNEICETFYLYVKRYVGSIVRSGISFVSCEYFLVYPI